MNTPTNPNPTTKKSKNRIVESGKIYVTATFNNTLVSVSDEKGAVIATGSSGMHGFSGTRKSTPYAATVTTETVLKKVSADFGMRKAVVFMKGIGPGREAALRAIKGSTVDIDSIIDVTPVPHNGVRPPKVRRV
jgi:small subunit ribosomal protein S11